MKTIAIILLGFFLTSCSEQQALLEQIGQSGELRVITRHNPTTCYRTGSGFAGFEYRLAQRFAEELGVRLTMVLVENDSRAIEAVQRRKGHLVVGLRMMPGLETSMRFGPAYQQIHQQVVYRRAGKRLDSPDDLPGKLVEVASGRGYAEMLRTLASENPDIIWRERPSLGAAELLSLVLRRRVDVTIAGSNEIALLRQRYPDLGTAFTIGEPQSLAWGIPLDVDDALHDEIRLFFEKIKGNGELEDIIEYHYGHMEHFDYVATHRFLRHVKGRLPKYISHFKAAADRYDLDWRLLSAIGYQESHWDPHAVSPTGVRGIMMLTASTAKQVGVVDRTDEWQSILGGARYFAQIKKRIPARIGEPDRTWFALAAYNVGMGHLEDVRILTQGAGASPDRWRDVRRFLPLISRKEWYTKTKHGYARGHEPVQFVRNIRLYYDRLVWLDEAE